MELDALAPQPPRAAHIGVRVRSLLRPAQVVALSVALSALVQTLLAWRRSSPGYYPDEYMYAELGRSLVEHGAPLVRGEGANFLPLLYPVLTAPAWLWDDVELAYRSIQAFNSVAMSLAAVPVFLLARRLRLGDAVAAATAILSIALPELLYASSTMAEAVAYPLALAAAAAAVAAIERPSLLNQLAVLSFAGLATLARLQLALLFVCYLVAVAAVGLSERHLRRTLRAHWLAAGATGLVLAVGGAVALRGLGIYGSLSAYGVDAGSTVEGLGATALVLAYAAGWVVVPGALVALGFSLVRPRRPAEVGFAAFATTALALLLLQAGVFGDVGTVQERYVMYALPLVLCAFALGARRERRLLRLQVLLAGCAATAAAVFPLAGYTPATDRSQSVMLTSLRQVERLLGDVGLASLAFAVAATIASALVMLATWRHPRAATAVAFGATFAVALGSTAAASALYEDKRTIVRNAYLPDDPSFVDSAADGPVTLLVLPRSSKQDLHTVLFWNREVRRLVLLGGRRPDAFAASEARADGAGRVLAAGHPVGGLVLVDGHGTTALLRDAERVATGPTKELWRAPETGAQLALVLSGRFYSGELATEGGIRVWPTHAGGEISAYLELDLSAPRGVPPVSFRVDPRAGAPIDLVVPAGATRRVRVPVCSRGVWTAEHSSGNAGIVHGSLVGLRSSKPRLIESASACS